MVRVVLLIWSMTIVIVCKERMVTEDVNSRVDATRVTWCPQKSAVTTLIHLTQELTYLSSARPHYGIITNYPVLVWGDAAEMYFLSSGREGSVISVMFQQELNVSWQLSLSVLLFPGTILTKKLPGWVAAAMHPTHFLRDCVNPPEILPQGFLGQYRPSCGCCVGQVSRTHTDGGRNVPAARGAALHVGWAGLGSCQRHRQHSTSGGESIMQCWHRNVCLEQVNGLNSGDCLPKWDNAVLILPQSRWIYSQMNSSRNKESLVSWFHGWHLWDLGLCLVCLGVVDFSFLCCIFLSLLSP